MQLLTTNQQRWLQERKIETGELYGLPRWGFAVSQTFDGPVIHMDTNPFTRSMDKELFQVKEMRDGKCRGNFYNRPLRSDFWLYEAELKKRDMIEWIMLCTLTVIPMLLYNLFTGRYSPLTPKP